MASEEAGREIRKVVIVLVTILLLLIGVSLLIWAAQVPPDRALRSTLQSLGSFITASIILGFLYRVTIRQHDDRRFEERLSNLLDQKIDYMFADCAYHGIERFERSIEFGKIFDSLGNEDTLWWLDTYDPKHHDWHENLEAALRRGASVNALVMHPRSPLAALRAAELGPQFSEQRFRDDLRAFHTSLAVVQANTRGAPGRLEIVEYRDLPCAPIYVICNRSGPRRAYSSMFLSKPTAIKFPHIVWGPSEGDFLGALHRYVVEKWERNRSAEADTEIEPPPSLLGSPRNEAARPARPAKAP